MSEQMSKQMSKQMIETKPAYCCNSRLKPCECGVDHWVSAGDADNGDWTEEKFDCAGCGRRIYIELPD